MSFQFSSQGRLGELGENTKNQGICDSDPERKGFRQFVHMRLVPCVQVVFIDWLVIVPFVNTCITHLNEKVFLIEFFNFLREVSGKTRGISFS